MKAFKKILCIILGVLLIFSLAVPAFASEEIDDKKITEAFLDYKNISTSDELWVDLTVFGSISGNTVFRADIKGDFDEPCMNSQQVIGSFIFKYSTPNGPENNPTGLYVLCEDNTLISALEAFESGLVSDEELANLAGGTPYNKYDPYGLYDYEKIIIPLVTENHLPEDTAEITSYSEIYKHYENEGESTPDYVLINLRTNFGYDMSSADILGDLILYENSANIPFTYGYGVYIPESGEIYDLTTAFERDIKEIEEALKHISFDALMGDNDGDKKLTIKDATYLQKCLAGLEEYREDDLIEAFEYAAKPPARYISDYNRDGKRNIKDATAIQKKLAKITE